MAEVAEGFAFRVDTKAAKRAFTTEARRHGEMQTSKARLEHTEVAEATEALAFRVDTKVAKKSIQRRGAETLRKTRVKVKAEGR
jgi:hypothetical protein